MTIEVSKTISIDARNTLVRNRDALQQKHGVNIFFPRNRVKGAFQDMIIKGGVVATTNASREIDHILLAWRQEFEAFKTRRARRKTLIRDAANDDMPNFPTVADTLPNKHSAPTSNNPFSALEVHTVHTTVPKRRTKKTQALTGWASVAAKPAQTATKPPSSPKTFTFGTTSSGAAFTFEPEHFDWAEAADTW